MGIVPAVVLGRGAGELAAAVAAGILTAAEALQLVADRSASNGSSRRLMPAARPASLPFLSSRDGAAHAGTDLGLAHWQTCLKEPGDVTEALRTVAARRVDAVLEIGPVSLLESCSAILPDPLPALVASLAGADRQDAGVYAAIGALYAVGADPRWKPLAPATGRCVRLPTYPWQRQRLWLEGKYRLAESPPVAAGDKDATVPGNGPIEPLAAPTVRPRPTLNAPYVAPQTALETDLARAWSEILHIERVGVYDNFFELGGDSLQATMLLNRLNDELGQPVPGQVLFRVQNIHDLAAYLRAQCPQAVRQRYPDEVVDASSDPARDGASTDRPGWTPVLGESGSGTIIPVARDRQAEAALARLQDLSDDEVALLLAQETACGELSSSE